MKKDNLSKGSILYEVDPHNRLVAKSSLRDSNVKGFRQVLYGHFKTDPKNRLYYEAYVPTTKDIPQKIEFSGDYSMDKNHNLIFRLDKWNEQKEGNCLTLKTGILDASNDEIIFLLRAKEPGPGKKETLYTMKLHGTWQVDNYNRLTFGVKKEDGSINTLTFFNAWKINKNNEIEYNYGGPQGNVIIFRGEWELKDRYRLSYVLDNRIGSGFDFKVSSGMAFQKDKKTYLSFEININRSKKRQLTRKITLFLRHSFAKDKTVQLEFSPEKKKTLGLRLTKKMFGQEGVAFLDSFIKGEERYLGGGLAFRW